MLTIRERVVMKPRPSWNCGLAADDQCNQEDMHDGTWSAGVGEKRTERGRLAKGRGGGGKREKRCRTGGRGWRWEKRTFYCRIKVD